jgi:hypothetical protein
MRLPCARSGPKRVARLLATAALLGWLSPPARCEELSAKDIQVIGRTLSFMEGRSGIVIELGIVYLRDEPESVRQAQDMASVLGNGLAAGKVELRPRLLAADQLGQLSGVDALFIVPTAARAASATAQAAERLHVPTISTDVGCAMAGLCVLAFHSEPTVEIFYSVSAAAGTKVRFTPAFRMLVRQL